MKIAISCDSSVDTGKELLKQFNIHMIPFTISINNETKLDGEFSTDEIFENFKKNNTIPKTSAVNSYQFDEHFKTLLKEYDYIIHLSMSADMSCAYSNAVESAKNFNNVSIINSKTLSTGLMLLCIYAHELVEKGLSPNEIIELVENKRPKVQLSFILNRLNFLHKSGRCGMIALLGANLLKIRPQIYVKDGKTYSGKKYRGTLESCFKKYLQDTIEQNKTPDYKYAFISYTSADDYSLIEYAYNFTKNLGFENIYITRANATVCTHCGDNCIGLLFLNK